MSGHRSWIESSAGHGREAIGGYDPVPGLAGRATESHKGPR